MVIRFLSTNINHLSEEVFKSVLDYENNLIDFSKESIFNSKIDCEDCKNLWLIKQNKESQVKHARCKSNPDKKLFDEEVKSDLKNNCPEN